MEELWLAEVCRGLKSRNVGSIGGYGLLDVCVVVVFVRWKI